MPTPTESLENLSESLEDYCLNKAMNQAKEIPLMNQENYLNKQDACLTV